MFLRPKTAPALFAAHFSRSQRWKRLRPASPTIPTSSREEKNNDNDKKCLGIHDVRSFQCLGVVCTSSKATTLRIA